MILPLLKKVRNSTVNCIGRARLERLAARICFLLGVDTLSVTYRSLGIGKYETFIETGEANFLEHVLPTYLTEKNPVFIEIGANSGAYTSEIVRLFPSAQIYAIEPSPAAFAHLQERMKGSNVHCYNIGCSQIKQKLKLYNYSDQNDSEHASVYEKVFTELHLNDKIESVEIELVTLDSFCQENHLEYCNFLKIDTEGHELNILLGAEKLIKNSSLKIIQFEFNVMNIYSRVFLRDFYDILSDFDLFRLDTHRLIPLNEYNPRNEIFAFQNLIAVRRAT